LPLFSSLVCPACPYSRRHPLPHPLPVFLPPLAALRRARLAHVGTNAVFRRALSPLDAQVSIYPGECGEPRSARHYFYFFESYWTFVRLQRPPYQNSLVSTAQSAPFSHYASRAGAAANPNPLQSLPVPGKAGL
ncbi:MAG: hypothetical protein BJ554DRAFT_1847, partial [Olpidium bornovanus]